MRTKKLFFLLAAFCVFTGLFAQGASDEERNKKARQALMKEFQEQKQKDELFKVTENSFCKSGMVPLAGRPVLLAAGIKVWLPNMSYNNIHHWVKFSIVKGKGALAPFPDYDPGQDPPAGEARTLEAYGQDGSCAYAWLVTDPAESGEVVVKAVFSTKGDWAPFADPQSAVTFQVRPMPVPEGKDQDLVALKNLEYQNVQKPSLEVLDSFGFKTVYPPLNIDYTRRAILRLPEKTVILNQNPDQSVTESSPGEELADYQARNERWRYIPQGLNGRMTHWDAARGRFGTTAKYASKLSYSYGTPPEIQIVEFAEYDPNHLPAGPAACRRLLLQGKGPDNIRVTQEGSVSFNPLSQGGFEAWGSAATWTSPTILDKNRYDYRDQIILKLEAETPGTAKEAARLLKLNWDQPPPAVVVAPDTDFLAALGFAFQDVTPGIIKKLPAFSRPAGPILTQVSPDSPASSMGLAVNDILMVVDSQPVRSSTDLAQVLKARDPDDPMALVYWRDGVLLRGWLSKVNP